MNAAAFLKQAVQHPASTGAVAPSSKRLSQLMVKHANLADAECVVELGPGTGAITKEILPGIRAGAQFMGIERNASFVELLQKSFSSAKFICGNAEDLPVYLENRQCDRVISGLPWAGFPGKVQNRLLAVISESLCESGLFLTFAYHPFNRLPRGRLFYRQLQQHFKDVKRTEIVVNFPPASIYVCSR